MYKQQIDLAKLNDSDEELLATAISINKLNQNKSTDISQLKKLLNPKGAFKKMDKKLRQE